MHWQYTFYIPLLLIAAAISAALALYVGKRVAASGAATFMLLMLAVAEWSLGYALRLASVTLPAKLFWTRVRYLGIVIVPAAWLAFALQYTGQGRWLKRRNIALLIVEPLAVIGLAWTNEAHHLIWTDVGIVEARDGLFVWRATHGIAFWIHTVYSYLLLLLGSGLLIQMLVRSSRPYRGQVAALLMGTLAPWVGNVLSTFGLVPFLLDLTPFAFTITGLVVALALFRFRLFDVMPVARDAVLESMSDGVFVLDVRGRIVDLNPAAQRMIGRAASEVIGEQIASVLPGYADIVGHYRRPGEPQTESSLCTEIALWIWPEGRDLEFSKVADPRGPDPGKVRRYFEMRISPLYARRGRLSGRLVILHDVSERNRQATLYRVLRALVGQLTPGSVMQTAVESIAQLAGWSNVVVALPSEDGTHWVVHAAGGTLLPVAGRQFPIEQGIVGRALRTAETQLVADVTCDPEYIAVHAATRSELAIPLRRGEQVLGVLALESERPAAFDMDDVRLAESLADAIALTMDNARLYEQTRRHLSNLDMLYTVARTTGQSLALEDVLTRALSLVLISMDFDGGLICLVDPADARLYLVAEHGLPSVLSRHLRESGLEGMPCVYVHEGRESLAVSDLRSESWGDLERATVDMGTFGLRAYAGVPLLHHERSLGVMSLFNHYPRSFSAGEMALLEAIGRHMATAVANARLFRATVNERQRLLTLIESSRDGIVLVGLDKRMLVVNAPALELLGLSGQPKDWTERPIREALDVLERHVPSAAQAVWSEMTRVEGGDEPASEGEFEVFPRSIHWLNLPVLADETPLGRLLVLHDVTEERLLAKMRDDLTHTMVHDLRNPLTGISTALQLLDSKLTEVITPAQHRLFEIANNSTQRMVDLVNSILDLGRLEKGRMPLNCEPVSLPDLLAETLRLQSPLYTAKKLRVQTDVSPTLPLAWADAELIERVLQNLVGNAIKFTPAGGAIKIAAWQSDGRSSMRENPEGKPFQQLCVCVADTGSGISPDLRDRLFQKFVVGEQEERGSGLGLAFCKLAVEAHGGRIWVEGESGEGATFVFTLPIFDEDSLPEAG